jgi:hypothetical protein
MRAETRLTCSAGVAPNKRLAKVCSDINKPDGQYVLPASRDAVLAFISSLPIRKVRDQDMVLQGRWPVSCLLQVVRLDSCWPNVLLLSSLTSIHMLRSAAFLAGHHQQQHSLLAAVLRSSSLPVCTPPHHNPSWLPRRSRASARCRSRR